jgi:hypothetical protein
MHIPHYIILVRVNTGFHISLRHPLFFFYSPLTPSSLSLSLSLCVASTKLCGNHQDEGNSSVISETKIIIVIKKK